MRSVLAFFLAAFSASALAVDCSPDSLRSELLERRATDQAARQGLLGGPPPSKERIAKVLAIDADNTKFMRSVIDSCQWPKASEVGEEGAPAAWLLVQHADQSPDFQVEAARKMRAAVASGEASAFRFAILVDRNRRLTHLPQVYGHQFEKGEDGVVRFFDITSPHHLDTRRKEIGLKSFYCFVLEVAGANDGARFEWPVGVPFVPETCGGSS